MLFVKSLLLVLLPLVIGVSIYACGRPESTLVFSKTGLKTMYHFPHWVIHNVPDGLWLFSLLNCLHLIWQKTPIVEKVLWMFIVFLLAILSEFLQRAHILAGTFDYADILAYSIALIVSIFCNNVFLHSSKTLMYE